VIWRDSVKYSELKNYVMMADVVVLPTMVEWFGLAIAEVCALDKAIVTTNVGSVPEVVGGTVALVEPWNPEDIARGEFDLFHQRWLALDKKIFSWEECVQRFIGVYEKLL
jgi:glycosyltransferase involved in cell wall biosynthesis